MKFINHSSSFITDADIQGVVGVLRRNYVGAGDEVRKLESSFKRYSKRGYGIGVNNGSSALKLSLLSLGLRKKSEIVTSVYVCPAVVNVIMELGYVPGFIDVGKNDVNISLTALKSYIKNNKNIGAIIIPYIGGYAIDVSEIMKLNIPIIEDCAASIGSRIFNKQVGGSGALSIFSFGSTKMITGGSGGLILTDSKRYYDKIRNLMSYDNPGAINYQGYPPNNYHMNDIQAALARGQFNRLDSILKMRKKIARGYDRLLTHKENITLIRQKDNAPSYYRYVFLTKDKKEVIKKLKEQNIDARESVAHCMHRSFCLSRKKFTNAVVLERQLISLPIYPNLSREGQARILKTLDRIL